MKPVPKLVKQEMTCGPLSSLLSLMKLRTSLLLLAMLVADCVVAYAAMGPCKWYTGSYSNTISCDVVYYCTGHTVLWHTQSACQNENSTSCTEVDSPIMSVNFAQPFFNLTGPCFTVSWYPLPYECLPAANPYVVMGGVMCQ